MANAQAQPTPPTAAVQEVAHARMPAISERTYLSTVKSLIAGQPHNDQTDAYYVQAGHDICDQVAGGFNWTQLAADAKNNSAIDANFYRALTLVAVQTFCPEQADNLAS